MTSKHGTIEELERTLRLEERFAQERRQKIESISSQEEDRADDLFERRRLRRERKMKLMACEAADILETEGGMLSG